MLKNMHNGNTEEQVTVYRHGLEEVRNGNYYGRETVRMTGVEMSEKASRIPR